MNPYYDGILERIVPHEEHERSLEYTRQASRGEGKQIAMMLDGLSSGPEARRNVMGPVLLTLDCVPVVEAMRKELLEDDQARGTEKPNI